MVGKSESPGTIECDVAVSVSPELQSNFPSIGFSQQAGFHRFRDRVGDRV